MEERIDIHKILVPVDYSESSVQACRYALKIASKAKAELFLFHAFYSPAFDLIELSGNKSTQKKLREEVTQKLMVNEKVTMQAFRERIVHFPEAKKISPDQLLTDIHAGEAKKEIPALCATYRPDLVVMGSHGRSDDSKSILGSITEYAIKRLPYPILSVPVHYSFVGHEKVNNILFLTDYDESDFVSIKKLMGFAHLMNMSIYCLHIGSQVEKWDELKMNGLKQYFKTTYHTVKVECDILNKTDSKINSINQYVLEKNINIISITTRKRNIIEKYLKPSLTKKLFYQTNIPLLVFHS